MADVDALLQRVVDARGNVAYADFDADPTALEEALEAIANVDLESLRGDARYAFLLNAYNIAVFGAVRRVLWRKGRPRRTLRHPWTWLRFFLFTTVRVGRRRMSLYELEFRYIKPHLRADARGHFALVCASTGCPPLRGGAYHAETLDDELELSARAFFRPGSGYRLDREKNVLWLNRILKWYRKDFASLGGVRATFRRYADPLDRGYDEDAKPRIRWLRYDWDLNVAK